jgi:hypothetical protein
MMSIVLIHSVHLMKKIQSGQSKYLNTNSKYLSESTSGHGYDFLFKLIVGCCDHSALMSRLAINSTEI